MARRSTTKPLATAEESSSHAAVYERRIRDRLAQYEKDYKIEDLNNSNDKTLLMILIRSELLLEDLQRQLQVVLVPEGEQLDIMSQANEIKKLSDLVRDLTTQITTVQKTLDIDRKSRKKDAEASAAEYIRTLKKNAKEFLDQRATKIHCPDCGVMVGRVFPVHEHTAYRFEVQCSQCHRMIIAKRDERDIWFDIKDAEWRRQYPAEVVQTEKKKGFKPSEIRDVITGMDQTTVELEFDATTGIYTRDTVDLEETYGTNRETE